MTLVTLNHQIKQGFIQGDSRLISNCYKETYPHILSYILSNNGTEEEAKQIVWLAMEKFQKRCMQEGFVLEKDFKDYFFGICKYSWLDYLKKKQQQRKAEMLVTDTLQGADNDWSILSNEPNNEWGIEERLQLQETLNLTIKAIQSLSDLCQEIFQLVPMAGKAHGEVAELLDIKKATSRKRLKDCRIKLRAKLRTLYGAILGDEPLMRKFVGI